MNGYVGIYEIVNRLDDAMKVHVVHREGYSIHHLWDGDAKHLKEDWKDSVVLWGRRVLEKEPVADGIYLYI